MIKNNQNLSIIAPILRAIFVVAFFIAIPAYAQNTYCHNGALINLDYNSSLNANVWTQGLGSSNPSSLQGFSSLSQAQSYINSLGLIGYKYNQCLSQVLTPVITPVTNPVITPNPGYPSYTYPQVRTTKIEFDNYNDRLNMYGYLYNLGNDITNRTGFCIYEKNYGFTCSNEIVAQRAQYYPGEFSSLYYSTNNLKRDTQYCVRAFSYNTAGRSFDNSYNDQCFFTRYDYINPPYTPPYNPPNYDYRPTVRTTQLIYSYTDQKADFKGYLDFMGYGYGNSKVGFCLYKQGFTFNCDQDLVADYNRPIIGEFAYYQFPTNTLAPNSRYCIRAYAENQYGRQYSSQTLDRCFDTISLPNPIPTPQPQPTPTPNPQPIYDCSYFEQNQKDKFDYCGKMGYQNICFNGKTKSFLGCMANSTACIQRYNYTGGINCSIASSYNNYTVRNTNLSLYGRIGLIASGYFSAGQARSEVGFAIYEKNNPTNIQYVIVNQNQPTGAFSKIINYSQIGGAGKQYCSKAYYVKDGQKILSNEEKCR